MKNGVNLIGYARAESGLGEACRSAAKALQSVGVPFCIINFPQCPSRQNDLRWIHKEVNDPIYATNIFFINADQLYFHYKLNNLKREWFKNRYNIGYWHWELPEFPNEWVKSSKLVNEIWVSSIFTSHSISLKTTKPVFMIPHSISIEKPNSLDRKYFDLPENSFLFLTMYDTHSTSERKNPSGTLEAFKRAFPHNNHSVGLILKISNSSHSPKEVELLKQSCSNYENIYFFDKILTRDEVNGLINVTDSLVSLHRSEGFGLTLAEAMYLGKPVIATNWSGNVDFTNDNNACVVECTLQKIDKNYGPYTKNQYWAEPNIDQAALLMNKLVCNPDFYNRVALLGKETIRTKYSCQEIGNMYKFRLNQLGLIAD